ncbi:MAG: glycosyltransferase family 9 protein [Deltaproteobacteria bacterium]|nr:glycosyltransferase family 9 protein [Deltaproteobacteria bacterium]
MKVLIIKLSSIGDVVQTLPALYALRKGFEKKGVKARIDWLVEEASSAVISGNPLIDNVIIVKNRGWKTHFIENIRTARMLASVRYDMVLDFQGLLKSGVWVWLSKGRRRIGFSNARELSHIFLNEKAAPYDPDRHAVDRYLDLAVYAGGESGEAVFPLHISGQERKKAEGILKGGGISVRTPFFVIAARARWRTKHWNDDAFAGAAKAIIEKRGMHAVLIGGRADKDGLDGLKERIGKMAVNLAGQTTLKELAALEKMSRFVLTVDSGPMHIASAVGAKTVALFGPTAPWRTGPYGRQHIIIRKELKCSPCFKKRCSGARCMTEITAEEVVMAVDKMLERSARL